MFAGGVRISARSLDEVGGDPGFAARFLPGEAFVAPSSSAWPEAVDAEAIGLPTWGKAASPGAERRGFRVDPRFCAQARIAVASSIRSWSE